MMTGFNTVERVRDLVALALEIEALEAVSSREALRLAHAMYRSLQVDAAADVRYVPTGQPEQVWVSWSVRP